METMVATVAIIITTVVIFTLLSLLWLWESVLDF